MKVKTALDPTDFNCMDKKKSIIFISPQYCQLIFYYQLNCFVNNLQSCGKCSNHLNTQFGAVNVSVIRFSYYAELFWLLFLTSSIVAWIANTSMRNTLDLTGSTPQGCTAKPH